MIGITIDGKHTSDFGLIMTACEIGSPEPITHIVSVPGRRTDLDLTEAVYGEITYKPRFLKFTFDHPKDTPASFQGLLAALSNLYHGKRVKVTIDGDPSWYWIGRMAVSGAKDKKGLATFVMALSAEPYKYAITSSLEKWKWDPFSFENGVIRYYNDLAIPESKKITVYGSIIHVTPRVKASKTMTVTVKGKTYTLMANAWTDLSGIRLGKEPAELTFSSTGTVSIEIREESL